MARVLRKTTAVLHILAVEATADGEGTRVVVTGLCGLDPVGGAVTVRHPVGDAPVVGEDVAVVVCDIEDYPRRRFTITRIPARCPHLGDLRNDSGNPLGNTDVRIAPVLDASTRKPLRIAVQYGKVTCRSSLFSHLTIVGPPPVALVTLLRDVPTIFARFTPPELPHLGVGHDAGRVLPDRGTVWLHAHVKLINWNAHVSFTLAEPE